MVDYSYLHKALAEVDKALLDVQAAPCSPLNRYKEREMEKLRLQVLLDIQKHYPTFHPQGYRDAILESQDRISALTRLVVADGDDCSARHARERQASERAIAEEIRRNNEELRRKYPGINLSR